MQGGLDEGLRRMSLEQLIERETPGYAVGGLAGGEDKNQFWRIVAQCMAALPPGKPRYVMGIGCAPLSAKGHAQRRSPCVLLDRCCCAS